eukprot:TRINITY_DN4666_c0_g1_i1.p1 TRINITY_DN4666_c0_g1~~TRINITY_DN4666_c0_g1_i1.p1  ORF type:complete len:103 (-),score=10.74 TRINITY_DN4666_c0_g1_i1:79-387(-)
MKYILFSFINYSLPQQNLFFFFTPLFLYVFFADAPWSRRYDFGAVSHFEEIFVIGGETGCCLKNDIWKSANPAANWTSLGNAPFEPRASFGLVSFLGKYKLP